MVRVLAEVEQVGSGVQGFYGVRVLAEVEQVGSGIRGFMGFMGSGF